MKKYIIIIIVVFAIIIGEAKSKFTIYTQSLILTKDSIEEIAYLFFPSSLFLDKADKLIWIDRLQAIYQAYKINFYKIEFFYNETEFDAIFYLKNNDKFYFCNGKMLLKEKIKNKEKYQSYFHSNNTLYSRYLISKTNDYDFYFSIYGKNKKEIYNNLVKIKILKKDLLFNKKNKAANKLKKIADNLEKLNPLKIQIKEISTFLYRDIIYIKKLSLHSFGIAIDIVPKYKNKFIYWYWAIPFVKEWWNISNNEKMYMPEEIVKIFESNYFYWGGRWKRFDIIHFEYKPEIFYLKLAD